MSSLVHMDVLPQTPVVWICTPVFFLGQTFGSKRAGNVIRSWSSVEWELQTLNKSQNSTQLHNSALSSGDIDHPVKKPVQCQEGWRGLKLHMFLFNVMMEVITFLTGWWCFFFIFGFKVVFRLCFYALGCLNSWTDEVLLTPSLFHRAAPLLLLFPLITPRRLENLELKVILIVGNEGRALAAKRVLCSCEDSLIKERTPQQWVHSQDQV